MPLQIPVISRGGNSPLEPCDDAVQQASRNAGRERALLEVPGESGAEAIVEPNQCSPSRGYGQGIVAELTQQQDWPRVVVPIYRGGDETPLVRFPELGSACWNNALAMQVRGSVGEYFRDVRNCRESGGSTVSLPVGGKSQIRQSPAGPDRPVGSNGEQPSVGAAMRVD